MILDLIFSIIKWCVISFLMCILGFGVTWVFYEHQVAVDFLTSYIFQFNGILIFGVGYGVLFFIQKTQPSFIHNFINNILKMDEVSKLEIIKHFEKSMQLTKKHLFSIIITIIGGSILLSCGYPLHGFPKYYLAICSISLFYVGGLLFNYLLSIITLVKKLDVNIENVRFQNNSELFELENFNNYTTLSFLGGVTALYLAFRGTLTANFKFPVFQEVANPEIMRQLLVFPIVIFLPVVLFSGFYIRYILRKIHLNNIRDKVKEIDDLIINVDNKNKSVNEIIELQKTILEIKERLVKRSGHVSILSIKDSPSILITIILFLQFIYQNDTAIHDFFKFLIDAI